MPRAWKFRLPIEPKDGEGKSYSLLGYNVSGKLIVKNKIAHGENRIMLDPNYKGLIFIRILDEGNTIYAKKY